MSILPTTTTGRRLTVIGAVAALAGSGIVAGNLAGAASGLSALDYAQCQNGGPGSTATTHCSTGSWINGILNTNNSHYNEDEVTPQRLTVQFPGDKGPAPHIHTITLRYLDRKAGIHAYDYLAAANATMSDAITDRCAGIPSSYCPTGSASTASVIPAYAADTTPVLPDPGKSSGLAKDHMNGLKDAANGNPKLNLSLFGGTFTTGAQSGYSADNPPAISTPSHDNSCLGCGDDYATVVLSFTTDNNAPHNVQLLFGGHLAAGFNSDAWGENLGSGSVSGGPYHIKWAAADGVSVGNRDNQIMSGAIGIIASGSSLSTTPSPSSPATIDTIGNVSDSATVTVADGANPPTGSVVFDLYGPFTTQPTQPAAGGSVVCVDPPATGENQITELTDATYATTSIATQFTFDSGAYNLGADTTNLAIGWYQWVARYVPGSNDKYNLGTAGNCWTAGEQLHVTQASATGVSTQHLTDTVTVTPGFGSPTGTVTFEAYTENTCQDTTKRVLNDTDNALDSNNQATSDAINANTATGTVTYYWKVTYNGDTNNASGVIEACGVQTAAIQNHS